MFAEPLCRGEVYEPAWFVDNMIKIKIIAIGKVKENSVRDLLAEYEKRLSRFCDISMIEIEDEQELSDSKKDIDRVVNIESDKILQKLDKSNDYKLLLDITGKELSSIELADKISNIINVMSKNLTFIIGGSNGVNDDLKNKVDFRLSFSKLTFPHQLFRVIVLEQIYRSFKIINNEKYHK